MEEATIKAQLSMGISPLDIMHGYLKELMYDTQCLQEVASDGDQYNADYLEGRMDALGNLYSLTYKISFAQGE
jgi:hypothetical protein